MLTIFSFMIFTGGKNANIIFEDCDFEKSVNISINAAFSNQGEVMDEPFTSLNLQW